MSSNISIDIIEDEQIKILNSYNRLKELLSNKTFEYAIDSFDDVIHIDRLNRCFDLNFEMLNVTIYEISKHSLRLSEEVTINNVDGQLNITFTNMSRVVKAWTVSMLSKEFMNA